MKHWFCGLILAVAGILLLSGCQAVQTVDRADSTDMATESTIVFTRPARYATWGTNSLREYIEVTYERFYVNEAGQNVLEVGLRYRGATNWYDFFVKAPESITFAGQTNFYSEQRPHTGAPLYSTNRQTILIRRGDTFNYRAVSPRKGALSYQLVLSESGELAER